MPKRKTAAEGVCKVTIPNLISVFRLLIVPVIVWLIIIHDLRAAFWLFVLAGFSDFADGLIARLTRSASELGAYLDPIADKALMVTIYVCLAIVGELPSWLVIMVVSRDILIIGAVLLSWTMNRPVRIRPLFVSKANTAAQIILAAMVLGASAFAVDLGGARLLAVMITAMLTVVSTAAYLVEWLRHMSAEHPAGANTEFKQAGQGAGKS